MGFRAESASPWTESTRGPGGWRQDRHHLSAPRVESKNQQEVDSRTWPDLMGTSTMRAGSRHGRG